ncbi:MAG TPA: hypothetical protein VN875_18880 [Candidatus Binatus sp.]|nr:hypothetical protein [Candidatus Binatus sp.]
MENEKVCPIRDCSICARSAGIQDAIADCLLWREPPGIIAQLFAVRMQDLAAHFSTLRPTEKFPFFENFQFLLRPSPDVDPLRYLKIIEAQVTVPRQIEDQDFCKIVGSVAGYFGTEEGSVNFLDYIGLCEKAMSLADGLNLSRLPVSFFRSEERIKEIKASWLIGRPMHSQIRIYGNGAVTLGRIARFAFVQGPHLQPGSNFEFSQKAKTSWFNQIFHAWVSHRIWAGRTLPVMRNRLTNPRTGELSMTDADYFLLRITDAAILASQETKQVEPCEVLDMQDHAYKDLQRDLRGVAHKYSKRTRNGQRPSNWRSSIDVVRNDPSKIEPRVRDKRKVLSEEIRDVEIPFAIGKAVTEDRTPVSGWWEKNLEIFEERKSTPIVTRVNCDLIDLLYPNKETIGGKEERRNLESEVEHSVIETIAASYDADNHSSATARESAILSDTLASQEKESMARLHARITVDQIGKLVCHRDIETLVWRGKFLEGKTLEELARTLKLSKSRVGQILDSSLNKARQLYPQKS